MTQPLHPEELRTSIASVVVTDTETGDAWKLSTRADSACHFFEPFAAGGDSVELRLHWSDIDDNGQPRLDADFLDPATGKHRSLTGARRYAHHTDAEAGGPRHYVWEFAGLRRQLVVAVSWLAAGVVSANASVSGRATVIRASDCKAEQG